MATFALNSVNKKKFKYLLFFSLIILLPNSSFSEINVSKIKNRIHVLNIHGKRFFLNEDTNIRSGDYLSTRKEPATIVFQDNTKLCFSSNSSLKVSKNKNQIYFDFIKGSILFSINKKSYEQYNLNFFLYNLKNIKDIIILSKKNNLEITNFKNNLSIIHKDDVNKISLPSFTILELTNNGKVYKKKILYTYNFSREILENCMIKLPNTKKNKNKNFNLQYGCISQNGKLICGNK